MSVPKPVMKGIPSVSTPHSRVTQISAGLQHDAKGAVKVAIDMLSMAASATQNVPYIGIISGVLTELLRIQDEVNTFKSEWQSVMSIALQIKRLVDSVQKQCEMSCEVDEELPAELAEPFRDLEQCIAKSLETLNACMAGSPRLKNRIRLYLNRSELLSNVMECRTDIQTTLDLFNARLHIMNASTLQVQSRKLDGQDKKLDALLERHPVALSPKHFAMIIDIKLPPAPAIFHGRADEVDRIVNVVLQKAPARIAILGPGGIGKTSIALSALYNADVVALYSGRRFFLSCEATSTAESLVRELLNVFGLVHLDGSQRTGSPLDTLLLHLRTLPDGILCLDNIETPWDADTHATENVLATIATLPNLALLVTARGANRPRSVSWTQPFLPQIVPLTLESALATWNSICECHDHYSVKLVEAVDCVPLAVTILAHLAESESSQALWMRWEREQTELLRVHGPDHRLSSVDISIQMSLDSPRLRNDTELLEFFSLLCILPQGMPESRITAFSDACMDSLPNMRRSITRLKQCSLVFSSKDGFLRVLSPVRHYMQTYHRVSASLFSCASTIYRALVDCEFSDFSTRLIYAKDKLQPELANISTVLRLSLPREPDYLNSTLSAIQHFSRLSQILFIFDTTSLLSEAITYARRDGLGESEANLLLEKGRTHFFRFERDEALVALLEARRLYKSLGDKRQEAECLQTTGDVCRLLDRLHEAVRVLQEALDLFVDVGYRRGRAGTLTRLGELYVRLGSLDQAERSLRLALKLYDEETGVRLGQANAMRHLGGLYVRLGRVDEAESTLRSALRLYTDIGAGLGRANTWLIMAKWYLQLGRFVDAESVAHCAMEIYLDIGGGQGEANVSNLLGRLYTQTNRLEEAASALRAALRLYRELGNELEEVNVMNLLGFVCYRLGLYEDARTILSSSSELCQRKAFMLALGTSHRYLGLVHRDCARLAEAKLCFEEALRCYKLGGHVESAARVQEDLSVLQFIAQIEGPGATEIAVTLSDPETASIRLESAISEDMMGRCSL